MNNWLVPSLISAASRRLILLGNTCSIRTLVKERDATSRLIAELAESSTSEEVIASGSEEPADLERDLMGTPILRATTPQMVLGSEVLFLPDDHPLLQLVNNAVHVQGRILVSSDGPSLTEFQLNVHLPDDAANVLISSIMTARAESPVGGGVDGPVVLPREE